MLANRAQIAATAGSGAALYFDVPSGEWAAGAEMRRRGMKVQFARADASQLAFHLFDRTIHPELFDSYAETHIAAAGFEAVLRICDAGHAIEFRHGPQRLTEIIGAADQQLPQRGKCAAHRLRTGRDLDVQVSGIEYCCSAHVELLDQEVFERVHGELLSDTAQALLSYEFPGRHRLETGAVSLLRADATARSLIVHAFHTFPESRAVLRTQSMFNY